MRTGLVLVGGLMTTFSWSQGNFPFPTSDAIWKNRIELFSTVPPIVQTGLIWNSYCVQGQDTLINGLTYTVLDDCEGNYVAAIREQLGRVMIVPADSASAFLLYDLSIPSGVTDSLEVWDKDFGLNSVIATGIGPDLNGRNLIQVTDGYSWIEGIGNTAGLLGPNQISVGPTAHHLDCMSMGDTTYYPTVQPQACVPYTEITEPIGIELGLYPVPASEVLQVQRPRADLISYQVLDISGRIVQAGVSEQRTISISVAALSPEVYVLRLLEWERQIAHERFLVAR